MNEASRQPGAREEESRTHTGISGGIATFPHELATSRTGLEDAGSYDSRWWRRVRRSAERWFLAAAVATACPVAAAGTGTLQRDRNESVVGSFEVYPARFDDTLLDVARRFGMGLEEMEYAARGEILPRVVKPGPDNPLGTHALYLGFPTYLIHGTNRPFSIGMRVSHGCIRLYPEDDTSGQRCALRRFASSR